MKIKTCEWSKPHNNVSIVTNTPKSHFIAMRTNSDCTEAFMTRIDGQHKLIKDFFGSADEVKKECDKWLNEILS